MEGKFLTAYGEDGIFLREDHPKVEKALAPLRELRRFMEGLANDEDSSVRENYETEHQELFLIDNRAFWSSFGLL